MNRSRVVKSVIIGVSALVLILSGCNGKKSPAEAGGVKLEKLRYGYMTDTISAYIADIGNETGIWKKNGIDLESASFSAGINTIDAVTTGQMDIGGGADFAVLNRFGGSVSTPLRIFTATGENRFESWKLYSRNPTINTPADLKGKALITDLGTVEEYWNARTLAAGGIDPADWNILPMEGGMEGVALIQSGKADAMWANARTAVELSKLEGIHVITDLSVVGAPTLSFGVSTEKFLTEKPQVVQNYLKAVQEIYTFIEANPQQAAEILKKTSGTPVEQALLNLQASVIYIDFAQRHVDALQNLYQWMEGRGIVKYPYDVRSYTNVSALKAAFPGRGEYK